MVEFSVYIIECGDGSLYTGIAIDVERRIAEHRSGGRGARYLRGRGPLRVVFAETIGGRSRAQRVEHRIKKLTREQKLALVEGQLTLATLIDDQEPLTA